MCRGRASSSSNRFWPGACLLLACRMADWRCQAIGPNRSAAARRTGRPASAGRVARALSLGERMGQGSMQLKLYLAALLVAAMLATTARAQDIKLGIIA